MKDMSYMFNGYNTLMKLTTLDVSHFNTSNVQDMYGMFNRDASLTKLDLSKWDISKLIHNANYYGIHWLVESCSNLTTVGDISKWNISGVGAYRAFVGCPKLTTLGPIDTFLNGKLHQVIQVKCLQIVL